MQFKRHMGILGAHSGYLLTVIIAIYWSSKSIYGELAPAFHVSMLFALLLSVTINIYKTRILDEAERELEATRKLAAFHESEFQKHREMIDALAEDLEVAVFLCTGKGMVEYANRKAQELFRFPDPRGRTVLAVTLSHDLESMVWKTAQSQQHTHAEIVFRYPEERVGLAHAWSDPNERDRVFLSIYEITDLRRLERVRRDFVANVSHELRTPMTNIRSMAETLADGDEEDLQTFGRKYLDRIVQEVDRLILISDDLLTLATAESNPVDKRTNDLAEIVMASVHDLTQQAASKGLTLNYEGPAHLNLPLNGPQIKQVVLNLVENAVKYTQEGGVEVTLEATPEGAQLKVKDTGIGIPTEHQPRIFERFYRVDKGRSRATGGTGLGLSIVKHIVESHGGHVSVQSELNKGTTMSVFLPNSTDLLAAKSVGDPRYRS